MILEDPLLEPLLVLIEWEVPVLGLLLGQRVTVDGIVWLDEFVWREGSTALLALVAVGASSVATRTLAADIAVGEELLGV